MTAQPFQVDFRKLLSSRARDFDMRVSFASAARRVVIFGASGSGKSMTLQAMAGLVRPDEGRIVIGGEAVFDSRSGLDLPARERRIGFVFQDYALFPHLTVRENIGFATSGTLRGRLGAKALERVDELLERFHIQGLADSRPAQISGGQRQRVAMARALFSSPRALFLDEPLSALDPLLREEMRRELLSTLAELSIPALVISHDPQDVETFAEALVVMKGGRVAACLDYAQARAGHPSAEALLRKLLGASGD